MYTNLNRTSEKSIFDVNRMLRNYGLTRLRMLSNTELNWVYRFTALPLGLHYCFHYVQT